MTEGALGVLLALAWFGAVNVVISTAALATVRAVAARTARHPARAARLFLALKLLPGVVSLAFTLLWFVPAHWRLEPAGVEESAGSSLVVLAAAGAVLVGLTARRAFRDVRSANAIARRWLAVARPLETGGTVRFAVFDVPAPSPVMALVGFHRPAIFVARSVAAALTPEELEVSLAHEAAHDRTRDNVKRLLVACCPDALALSPWGRKLTGHWRAAMEFAADARAAGGSEVRAVRLASALVKVARLVQVSPLPATPSIASGLHEEELLAARVLRLLGPAPVQASDGPSGWTIAASCVLVLAAVLTVDHTWLAVHHATELFLQFLP